jgi:hypothetical protein
MIRLTATLLVAVLAFSETYEGRPALKIANDRIQVLILPTGATVASIIRLADPGRLNPLWNPGTGRVGSGLGHFLCLDGFGQPSAEERSAGLPGHGEAVRQEFTVSKVSENSVTLSATLPLLQEKVTRTYRVVPGEEVLYVTTRVESQAAFDRPMVWAEHATIGSPFLEAGVTAVDVSGTRSQTRPYTARQRRRLASGTDFTWPRAPLAGGGSTDIRVAPVPPDSMDHTTTLMEPTGEFAFATAIHPRERRLVAWVWRASDFPWLQSWDSYGPNAMARGLEFATQPYDIPRRQAVEMHQLFGAPTFRWLPAKAAVETSFLLIYTAVPEGFTGVRAVRSESGNLIFESTTGQRVTVRASAAHTLQRPGP